MLWANIEVVTGLGMGKLVQPFLLPLLPSLLLSPPPFLLSSDISPSLHTFLILPTHRMWDLRSSSVVKTLQLDGSATSVELSRDKEILTVAHGKTVTFVNASRYIHINIVCLRNTMWCPHSQSQEHCSGLVPGALYVVADY